MKQPTLLPFTPVMPWHEDTLHLFKFGPVLTPFRYTGWRDETTAWKDGSYLGTAISISPTYTVKGPDAKKFFMDHAVNNFQSLKVGGIRHTIMCNDEGQIIQDGVTMMIAEDEYYTCWLQPYIEYALTSGNYDAVGTDLTGKVFLFQVAGPTSLQILEAATKENLHDIKFGKHRMSSINGHPVRILRLGMAGSLAYEVHGTMDVAEDVYNGIWKAGQDFGIKKLGQVAYMMNHTEDGFPQANYHYPYPWYKDPKFKEFLDARPGAGYYNMNPNLVGSVGSDLESRFVTPVDVGWENRINFKHDFRGKEALKKHVEDHKYTMVTLEWNAEDVMDVYGSQFQGRGVEPYPYIEDRPNDVYYELGFYTYHTDWVLVGDKKVGISSGRSVSQYYRRMISLCKLEKEYAVEGNEVIVLWGEPGKRQKKIRAKVARFPYLDVERNSEVDVSKIPSAVK